MNNNNPQQKVSVIGLGAMGTALAEALLRAGNTTIIWNRTASKAEKLTKQGATAAETVAEAIEASPLIIVCVTNYAAFADSVTNVGFVPSTYENLKDSEFLITEGNHDVFGDGSVWILSTPGHTPGHQSLYVDLAETGPVVLSGDLYHFRFNRKHRRYPSSIQMVKQRLLPWIAWKSWLKKPVPNHGYSTIWNDSKSSGMRLYIMSRRGHSPGIYDVHLQARGLRYLIPQTL